MMMAAGAGAMGDKGKPKHKSWVAGEEQAAEENQPEDTSNKQEDTTHAWAYLI